MSDSLDQFLSEAGGYRTPEDAQRMRALIDSMERGRRFVALSSPHPLTMQHYSRLMAQELRSRENVQVVPYLPSSTDALLQRFNDLLSDIKVDDALRRNAPPQGPMQVFLVHDTADLSRDEFSLLVRLVNDLPGANLRIALIQERDIEKSGTLAALGPLALHWNILPPGFKEKPAEAKAAAPMTRQARQQALKDALLEHPDTPIRRATAVQAPARGRIKRFVLEMADAFEQVFARRTSSLTGRTAKAAGKAARGAGRPAVAAAASVAQRRNRIILIGGLALSAALAVTMGVWLSTHKAPVRGQPTAKPALTSTAA